MPMLDKRRERIAGFVMPQLEAGENVEVVVPTAQTGPSPVFGPLACMVFFAVRVYAPVLTGRRLLLLRCSKWTGRPKTIDAAYPRGEVRVERYAPGSLWGKLTLSLPGSTLDLNVHRMVRTDTDSLTAALGRATSAA
ncbi:MAG TPA: hypothetical protein VFC33_07980 [Acidimicrobiia bacterium]|nr:hypothetical protein [Acidimicrobiia bacterium]